MMVLLLFYWLVYIPDHWYITTKVSHELNVVRLCYTIHSKLYMFWLLLFNLNIITCKLRRFRVRQRACRYV